MGGRAGGGGGLNSPSVVQGQVAAVHYSGDSPLVTPASQDALR